MKREMFFWLTWTYISTGSRFQATYAIRRVDERCYGFPIIFFLFIHVMVIEINRKIEQSKRIVRQYMNLLWQISKREKK